MISVTRLGDFFKPFGNNFSYKSSPNFLANVWSILKIWLSCQKDLVTFWPMLGKIGIKRPLYTRKSFLSAQQFQPNICEWNFSTFSVGFKFWQKKKKIDNFPFDLNPFSRQGNKIKTWFVCFLNSKKLNLKLFSHFLNRFSTFTWEASLVKVQGTFKNNKNSNFKSSNS